MERFGKTPENKRKDSSTDAPPEVRQAQREGNKAYLSRAGRKGARVNNERRAQRKEEADRREAGEEALDADRERRLHQDMQEAAIERNDEPDDNSQD